MLKITKIVLLTGSNMGDSEAYLAFAKKNIEASLGTVIAASSIYKTAAWGNTNQLPFLNQVLVVASNANAEDALKKMLQIEKEADRVRTFKYAPRTLDIDILFFGNEIIEKEHLIVPHPQIQNRRFTLIPLVELMPSFKHPLLKKTLSFLLKNCTDHLAVIKIRE